MAHVQQAARAGVETPGTASRLPDGPWGRLAALPVAVAAAVAALGLGVDSPWGLAIAAWLLLTVALSSRLTASAAAGASVLVVLVPALVAVRTGPATGLPPRETATTCWAVLALVLAVVCVLARHRWARPSAATAARVLTVSLPGLVGLASVGVVLLSPGSALTAWAMRNDSANNVMFVRFLLEDGGVDPSVHPNPAYLLQGLVSLGLTAPASVSQTLDAYALLWIGITIAAAVCLAAVVASSVRRPGPAALGAVLVGCFTYSWFVVGFSMTYGFANVPLALLLLACSLLVARGTPSTAVLRTAVLVAGTVLLLATWAPLAVVPAALGLVALLGGGPRGLVARLVAAPVHSVVLGASLAAALAYAAVVVLPDLRTDGGNLSQGGAFPDLSPWPYVVLSVLALALATTAALRQRGRRERRGADQLVVRAVATVVAGGVAMAGLVALAAAGSSPVWGYYPQKLSWILAIVTVALVASLSLDATGPLTWRVAAPVVAALVVVGAVTTVVDGPGIRGYVPALKVARGIEPGAEEDARAVLRLADDPRPTLVWLLDSTAFDDLANSWLVASEATSVDDPIRAYAGTIEHDPEQVCAALRRLGQDAVVVTGADNVPAVIAATCPAQGSQVVVGSVASVAGGDVSPSDAP